MSVQNELLIAYIDGDLPPDEMARVEAEIRNRPDLRAYVEQQRALRSTLRDAFGVVLDAAVPERLLAAAFTPPSGRWRLTQTLSTLTARGALLWLGAPTVVALACGVIMGFLVATSNRSDIANGRGGLIARGALAAALSRQLAAQPERSAETRIGISSWTKTADTAVRLTRRHPRRWQALPAMKTATGTSRRWLRRRTSPAPGPLFQLAGSTMPDAVRSAVQDMISGLPLDAAGENQARLQGWTSH